jgi:hypothetical protein
VGISYEPAGAEDIGSRKILGQVLIYKKLTFQDLTPNDLTPNDSLGCLSSQYKMKLKHVISWSDMASGNTKKSNLRLDSEAPRAARQARC